MAEVFSDQLLSWYLTVPSLSLGRLHVYSGSYFFSDHA